MLTECFLGMHYVQISKNKYACLIMASHARLENAPPSFELIRISNHALQRMIEANSM